MIEAVGINGTITSINPIRQQKTGPRVWDARRGKMMPEGVEKVG
jgi:hypothetical protein